MKLTNQQIDAVVETIYSKEYKAKQILIDKKDTEARKTALPKAKELYKIYEKIPKTVRDCLRYNSTVTIKKIIDALVKESKIKNVSRDEIRNKVLIASIDSSTLDELKTKLDF